MYPAWVIALFIAIFISPTASAAPILIKNGYVLSMQSGMADQPHTDLLIDGNSISKIGKNLQQPDAEIIDASGKFVLPGFVDVHSHLWITTMRGQFRNKEGKFSAVSSRSGAAMQPDDVYIAMYSGALELLAAGITTSSDFFDNIRGPEWADAGYKALNDAGIRAIMFYGGPDKTTRSPIDLAHLQTLLAKQTPRVSLGLAWRLPKDLKDAGNWTMRDREYQFAREHHLPVQVHVSGQADAMFNALIQRDYLAPFVTVVHATDATPQQLNALEKAGGSLALTPISEAHVAYGLTRLDHFSRITRQGLGIDGNALAGSADMFATLRLAALLMSGGAKDEGKPDARYLLALATRQGAEAAGLGNITGTLQPGKRADVQIINPGTLNMSGFGGGDPAALIVYSARPENVDTVLVDGRLVKRDGNLIGVNMTGLIDKANNSARHLLE